MLEQAGYWIALLLLVGFPPAVLYWLLIHPLARFWRRVGPAVSLLVVSGVSVGLGIWIFTRREVLLGIRYPFYWPLAAIGVVVCAFGIWINLECRRQLRFRVLAGVPEVGGEPVGLVTEGIYARTRNPRYLSLLASSLGWALILNYPVLYFLTLALLPAFYVIIRLEERELRERYGEEYERYLRSTPRFFPRPQR